MTTLIPDLELRDGPSRRVRRVRHLRPRTRRRLGWPTSPCTRSSTAARSRRGSPPPTRGGYIITQRAMGLVNQVFKEHDLRALGGDLAIGHVRYSTTGSNEWENSQPVHRSAGGGGNRRELALAHNGNLINAVRAARRAASPRASSFTLDVGLGDHRGADGDTPGRSGSRTPSPTSMPRLKGAFSTVVMTKDRVVAFRDPAGLRPLVHRPARRRPLLRGQRVLRVRHHRRRARARRAPRRGRLDLRRRASSRRRSSRARARRSASSSTSTSRGPTRA